MKAIFLEADNSMEEMLNSSMSHFDKFFKNKDRMCDQNSELVEQNHNLKEAV